MSQIPPEVKRVLFTEDQIQQRVQQLADLIDKDYNGKQVILVGILKGAFIFCADLARKLKTEHQIEFMSVSSYGNAASSSGNVRILMDVRQSLENKHVLIVEDIIDTGYTLHYLIQNMKTRNVASVETVVFLNKKGCLKVPDMGIKYVGFEVDPVFVVGYGLDFAERFRTLPYVAELKEEAYKKK